MWSIGLCFYYYFVRILYLCMYILYICIGLEIFPHILNNKPAFCTLWKCHDRRKLEVGLSHVPIEWLQVFFIVHSTIGRSAHSVPLILNTVLGYMLASCSLCMSIITNHNNCLEVFYDFTVFFLLCIIIFRYFFDRETYRPIEYQRVYFTKWLIHPFISKGTIYLHSNDNAVWSVMCRCHVSWIYWENLYSYTCMAIIMAVPLNLILSYHLYVRKLSLLDTCNIYIDDK